jgi:hypothetical protein
LAWLASRVAMSNTLIWLFGLLDAFIEVNVCADWDPLHEFYMFVLELTSPLAAALALDCAQADACQQLMALVLVENDGGDVEVEGGRVEEVVKVEVVMLKVPAAPWPKPGGSKSVPDEWNKLVREKKEAKRKLVDKQEEAERKMSAEKGMAEEQEVEEMVDRPSEGKGKGAVRSAVGFPKVMTCGLAWRRIKSATVVVNSDEEDEAALAADPVSRAMPVTSLLKGRKVKVVLLCQYQMVGWGCRPWVAK